MRGVFFGSVMSTKLFVFKKEHLLGALDKKDPNLWIKINGRHALNFTTGNRRSPDSKAIVYPCQT